jgi:hypothetical protein
MYGGALDLDGDDRVEASSGFFEWLETRVLVREDAKLGEGGVVGDTEAHAAGDVFVGAETGSRAVSILVHDSANESLARIKKMSSIGGRRLMRETSGHHPQCGNRVTEPESCLLPIFRPPCIGGGQSPQA